MKPPIFLFLMFNGSLLSVAMRIKQEGYKIMVWVSPDAAKVSSEGESGGLKMGRGIIGDKERVTDYWETIKKHKPGELIIIVDDNGGGNQIDMLRKLGYKVIGGGSFVDKLEHDRGYGNEIALSIGLNLPKTYEFNSLSLAIAFCRTQSEEKKFVFKASGSSYAGSSKTYTAKNMTDLNSYLVWLREDIHKKKQELKKFELQSFVDGQETDISAYFNGETFVPGSIVLSFEKKKVGDSEFKEAGVGQATGCMGQVLYFLPKSKYFDQYIKKLTPLLKEKGYVGQIAINNIIEQESGKPYFLEFTPRFGFDSFFGELQIRQDDGESIAQFFINLVEKKPIKFNYDLISIAARVHCGSPGWDEKEVSGRFFSFDEKIAPNLWFYGVSLENDIYTIEGGTVMVACVSAPTLNQAVSKLYKGVIDKINLSDIYYRSKLHQEVPQRVTFLKKWGWI